MKRKFSRNCSLSVVAPFIAVLTLLITAAMLAQTSGTGRTNGSTNVVTAPAGTSALAQSEHLLKPWTDGAEHSPVSRSHTKRHGARPMDSPLLFMPVVDYSSGASDAVSVAVADVNGDGKPDLIVTNYFSCNICSESSVAVLLGNGDGTFQAAVTYDTGGPGAWSVAVADVNGDGKPDLIVANEGGTVGVLLGNGDGTFQPAVTYPTGNSPYCVAVADVNGDGNPDLLVVNWWDNDVAVLLGNGNGTFRAAVTYGSGGSATDSVAVADVNGDGKPDLLVGNLYNAQDETHGGVGVLLGNGDGTFQPAVPYSSGGFQLWGVAVADVNGDGKLDLLTANAVACNSCQGDGAVGVLLGNGDGTFQPAVLYDSGGGTAMSIAVADVNGDGKPDLAVANYGGPVVGVLVGNGDGTFRAPLSYGTGGQYSYSVAAADVNGDGKPDLVVASWTGCGPYSDSGCVGVLLNANATTTTLVSSPNPIGIRTSGYLDCQRAVRGWPAHGDSCIFRWPNSIGKRDPGGGKGVALRRLAGGRLALDYRRVPGRGCLLPSTSAPLNQVVYVATANSLASSANPARVKEHVTCTATVTGQYGGAATGTITFQDNGATIATVTLSGNQAAYTTSYGSDRIHLITATYSGDANNVGSMSAVLTEAIGAPFKTETVLTTSGSPSQLGQPVTFTATVTSKYATIRNGELVTFYDGKTEIRTGTTVSGVATSFPRSRRRHTPSRQPMRGMLSSSQVAGQSDRLWISNPS